MPRRDVGAKGARRDVPVGKPHIALVGFMGSGKSTIGRMLAARLGMPFVDLDETIVEKAGHPIVEIFREHGELGFRAHERAALREVLNNEQPMVLATGGGTFVDASMRAWLQQAARTVYLKASAEALWKRLSATAERNARPLLSGPDPMATMRRLLREREPAYEQADLIVVAEGLENDLLVERIAAGLRKRSAGEAPVTEAAVAGPRAPVEEPSSPAAVPSSSLPSGSSSPPARPASEGVKPRSARQASPRELLPPKRSQADAAAPRANATVSPHGESKPALPPHTAADDQEEEPLEERLTLTPDGAALLRVDSMRGAYAVELRPEAGAWLADAITAVLRGERLAVISDATVAQLHAEPLVADLLARDKQVTLHTFPAGEDAKSLETAAALYDELLVAGLTRSDGVVALGGGVTGDLAGFVASTFLRGIGFVQVPTTTLAAVDASIGGKTAVNTPRGKNLVGTFHAPRAVLVALAHLKTQPRRAHAAGLVEALKMAACMNADLFDEMRAQAQALLDFEPRAVTRALARAMALKGGVVGRDELERGERAVLNYGHTVGHAIEVGEEFRLLHGEAVALGMVAEAAWADEQGLSQGVSDMLCEALRGLEAPTDWRACMVDRASLGLDKKRLATGEVRMPVVSRMGTYELRSVGVAELAEYLEKRSV